MPFAVVGSNATIEVQGKKVRGRRYPWGVVEGDSLRDTKAWFTLVVRIGDFLLLAYVKECLTNHSMGRIY